MKRGACPTVFAPLATGDGLLARIKPPHSLLTAAQARAVAACAAEYGNGIIQVTTRASLQLRGLRPDGVTPFAAAMVAAGLAHPDPAVEARRTILANTSPAASPHAAPIATELAALLAADARLASLPPKFSFLVDGGGPLELSGITADIEIRLTGERCEIALDGSPAEIDPTQAAETAIRLALIFATAGPHAAKSPLPLAGEGWVRVVHQNDDQPARPPSPRPSPAGGRGFVSSGEGSTFGVGLPLGTMRAAHLPALADCAERHGDGILRLTPWRAFVIAGVHDPATLRSALVPLGLILDPEDPRLRIFACPGHPGCASATVDTFRIAAALARLHLAGPIHVSGCSKGCAHPAPAAITLVGRDGAFDLVRHGRAADPPAALGLTEAEALAVPA